MIQINLLPLESFRQTYSGRLLVSIFGFAMVALGILLYFYYNMVMAPNLDKQSAAERQETTELNRLKAENAVSLKQTTSFVEEMNKVNIISELEERRRDQARLFMGVADQVINQASWLVSCSHDNGLVKIKGLAIDHEVVANFLSRLQSLPMLQNVDLLRAAEDTVINGVPLVSFDISANTVFGAPSLLTDGLPSESLPPQEKLIKMVTLAAPGLADALKPKDVKKKL
ncbi:MAG: PilN domain-containing protein [Deltaproteobacteria bacterium]|jgi:Tfp pilus assembly protein PilN|nr:PilN domain-containing protein [Deltaproteobacteria bacterium]